MWTDRERGTALVTALLLTALLTVLAMALLAISGDETGISANEAWSERAFYAAEACVQSAVDQIGPDPVASLQPIAETTISQGYTFRSGKRSDTSAQPVRFLLDAQAPGAAPEMSVTSQRRAVRRVLITLTTRGYTLGVGAQRFSLTSDVELRNVD